VVTPKKNKPAKPLPVVVDKVAQFEATLTKRQREIDQKIDSGEWYDDWTMRVREIRERDIPSTLGERSGPNCKPRPLDSRNNRGSGDRDERMRFVPWCDRKK
jgi:hypothetical protein